MTVTLTADTGEKTTYALKQGWHQVTVEDFLRFQREIAPLKHPHQLGPLVEWLSGIPAAIIAADLSLAIPVIDACPWLNVLPEAGEPWPTLQHEGTLYQHIGGLDTITAGQLEGLLDFTEAFRETPTEAFPWLLAVMYSPVGVEQTAETVAAGAKAFASLPIAVAFPILQSFTTRFGPLAANIEAYSAARGKAERKLAELEVELTAQAAAQAATGFAPFWRRLRNAWVSYLMKSARARLSTLSSRKNATVRG